MNDFCDMTPAELEKALADELYQVMMADDVPRTVEGARTAVNQYVADTDRHIEVVMHPLTDEQKQLRLSSRTELRAKTAWGWLTLLRQQSAADAAREFMPITVTVEP